MSEKDYISATIVVILIITILDGLWLGVFNKNTWNKQVRNIQGSPLKARVESAIAAYIIMVIAVMVLGVSRIEKKNLVKDSLLIGATLGFCIYGIFNTTNYAIFKDYKFSVGITDLVWGTFLMSVATLGGAWTANHWKWFNRK